MTTTKKTLRCGRWKVRTIDIQAKKWFDFINGNSYFAAIVTLNFGLPGEKQIRIPFQYGYGDSYKDAARVALWPDEDRKTLWLLCQEAGIVLRTNKVEGCTKEAIIAWGSGK